MMPCVYREGSEWFRGGWNVVYSHSKLNRFLINRYYYSLSFNFQFYSNDTVWFAYSIPYSFSKLCGLLKEIETLNCVRKEILCKSIGGLDTPILTITDFNNTEDKEFIFITARVHPGETHGSWVMDGFLRYITSNSYRVRNLLRKVAFKIVPMLNPDGVVCGNTRCSLNGEDLNRSFQNPDPKLNSVIFHVKNRVMSIKKEKKLTFYFDMHAHSKKKGVFMYGPHFPLHSAKYYKIKVLPKLLSETTDMFRYYSCRFRNEAAKSQTARLVICNEFRLPYTYTIEISSHGYLNSERITIPFNQEYLLKMGQCLTDTLVEYIEIRDADLEEKELKRLERLRRRNKLSEEELLKLEMEELKDLENSLPISPPKRRTMADIINSIRDEPQFTPSDSCTESEEDQYEIEREELQIETNKNILKSLRNVESLIDSPLIIKSFHPIKKKKNETKLIKETKSTLAKYFSRAASSASRTNRRIKYRAESAIPDPSFEDIFVKNSETRPSSRNQDFSKFSYSRGISQIKPKPPDGSPNDRKDFPRPNTRKRDSKSICFANISKRLGKLHKESERLLVPNYENYKNSSGSGEETRYSPLRLRYPQVGDLPSYRNIAKKYYNF